MFGCILSPYCSMVFLTLSPTPSPFHFLPPPSLLFLLSFPLPSLSPFSLPPPPLTPCIHPFSSLASRGYHFPKFVPCSFSSFFLFNCVLFPLFLPQTSYSFSLSLFIIYLAVHFLCSFLSHCSISSYVHLYSTFLLPSWYCPTPTPFPSISLLHFLIISWYGVQAVLFFLLFSFSDSWWPLCLFFTCILFTCMISASIF